MSRGASVAAIAAFALIPAGCSGGSAAPPASSGRAAPSSSASVPVAAPPTPAELFSAAKPVAVEYVRDVALGRTAAAGALSAAPDSAARRTLTRLDRWLGSIPVG